MASYRDGRSRTSSAWEHFEISDAEAFIAKCNYCLELFSYRTSVTNLKKHVITKHPDVLGNTEGDENAEEVEEIASDTHKPKYYRTGVWEYYDIKDPVAKLAECRLCEDGSVLSYKTTSANLSKHLLRKHKIEFVVKSEVTTEDNDEEIPIERLESEEDHDDEEKGQVILHSSRPKSSIAWEHFDIQDDIQKIASCKLCGAICSYRTSVSNLLKHTRRKHGDVVSWERLEMDDDSKSLRSRLLKGRSIVWLYFKCVDSEREISECLLCQTRIGHGTGSHNLKRHLARRHPNVEIPGREDGSKRILLSSGGELYEVQTTDKETDGQDNDGEMDTVYLEDFDTLEEPPAKRKKFEDLDDVRNVDDSSSDDEVTFFNKYKKKKQDSTDLFGKYVASLLKQLPTEVSLRLQSDFVKQILNAQSAATEVATASAVNTVTDNTYTISAGNNEYVTSTEGSAYSITITAEKPDEKIAVLGIEETDAVYTDLWEYFERTEDGAKCKICDVSIDHDDEALKAHIQTSHGALVVEQSDSETEKADDEFFTEVVYLDDEKPKRAPRGVSRVLTKAQTRKSFSRQPIKVERMDFRKSSLSSDEASSAQKIIDLTPAKRPRTTTAVADTTDELDSFLVYIKSLLRTVPKESSTRLQMEIINLIMAEKFRQTAGQSTGSLDPEIVDVKSTSASSREMSEGNLTLQVYEA